MEPNKGVEKELFELERRYWQALKDRDVDTALRLTDETCIVTGPQGVGRVDKQSLAKMVKSPAYTLHDVSLGDNVQVRLLDDNVAILAYKVRETLTVDGRRVMIDAADASTWVRRNGQWVCAMHSEAIAGDPFGRDRVR
jgi:hypothetical protein